MKHLTATAVMVSATLTFGGDPILKMDKGTLKACLDFRTNTCEEWGADLQYVSRASILCKAFKENQACDGPKLVESIPQRLDGTSLSVPIENPIKGFPNSATEGVIVYDCWCAEYRPVALLAQLQKQEQQAESFEVRLKAAEDAMEVASKGVARFDGRLALLEKNHVEYTKPRIEALETWKEAEITAREQADTDHSNRLTKHDHQFNTVAKQFGDLVSSLTRRSDTVATQIRERISLELRKLEWRIRSLFFRVTRNPENGESR